MSAAAAVAALMGMVASWVLLSETVQGLTTDFPHYFFLVFAIRGSFAAMLLLWLPMAVVRWRRQTGAPLLPGPVPAAQLILVGLALSMVGVGVSWTWYLSLNHTAAAVNAAIFQSSAAAVFALSVPLLGERATITKVAALSTCLVGVAVVASAPAPPSADGEVTPSPVGYVWVCVATLLYALFQVLYGRFTEQRVTTCVDICRRGYVSAHSAEERRAAVRTRDVSEGGKSESEFVETAEAPLISTPASLEPPAGSPAVSPVMTPIEQAEISAFMVGVLGVGVLALTWPLFFVLDATGAEPFAWPSPEAARKIGISCALDTAFSASLLLCILLTTPLYTSLASILVVPFTALADWVLHGFAPTPQAAVGMALIGVGFALLQAPPDSFSRASTAIARACTRGRSGA